MTDRGGGVSDSQWTNNYFKVEANLNGVCCDTLAPAIGIGFTDGLGGKTLGPLA